MPARLRAFKPRVLAATAAVVAAALALSGCSSSSSNEPSESSGGGSDASLTLALGNLPNSIESIQISNSPDSILWSSLYDTLLRIDADGKYVPNAAESWQYSADAKVLTLTLRDDLSFSNGKPAHADAVVATLQHTMQTPGQAQTGTQFFQSVAAPDEKTVVITLTQPDPLLISNLASYLGVITDPETIGDPRNATNPVESGPYTLDTSATVTGSVYVMHRRDNYWDAANFPFQTLTVKAIQDQQARFNALQAGEIDADLVSGDQVPALQAAGFTIHHFDANGVGSIIMADLNGTLVPALADVRVRRAINMAFDRDSFVKNVLKGDGKAAGQKIFPGGVGYIEDLNTKYPYDPQAAKALLAEAGYPNGFAVTLPSTFLSQAFEPLVGQALADIGITVTWQVVDPSAPDLWGSKQYAMAWWIDGSLNPASVFQMNYGPDGAFNPFHYHTPELDKLFQDAALAVDADSAKKAYEAINQYASDNALSAPVVFFSTSFATKPGISYVSKLPPSPVNSVRLYAVGS